MAALGTLTLTGISGRKYAFEIYSKDTTFKALGAVYVITKRYKKPDGNFTNNLIYIGQTNDLSVRFDNHHRIACFNRNDWNTICIHLDEKTASRLAKERDLIDGNDPICNRD